MERLEHGDKIERGPGSDTLGIADHEGDTVSHPRLGRLGARFGYRCLVQVDSQDPHAWVSAGERDGRRSKSAAQIQHPRRRGGAQPPVDVGHSGQPGAGELVEEHRPVGRRDAPPDLPTVGGIWDATAGPVRLDQLRQYQGDACEHDRDRRDVVRAVAVEEHLGVLRGQSVTALLRRAGRIIADDVPGGRLLLEPLPGIPRGDAGMGGDLGLGGRPEVAERLVEPELEAQVHAERLQRTGHVVDQSFAERFAGVDIGVGCHASSSSPLPRPARRLLRAASPRAGTARVQMAYTRPITRLPCSQGARLWPLPGAPVGMAGQWTGVTRLQHEVEFAVLGPLEVRLAGRPVTVPGVRQRALLTALLVHRGIVVPFDRLVDEVFGEEPPEEARNALQTYVARLRHALGPAATVVVTRAPGYVLDVPGNAVDAEQFTVLLAQAHEAQAPTAALAFLEEALALWRGPAYAEFAETFARAETLRLQELRLAAQEDRAALLLRLGRIAEGTAALEAIVAEEPWRERAVELLVAALARAGRGGHALATYTRYRERVRDELGLDPSRSLRRLEQQVLRGELEPVQPRQAQGQRHVLPAPATSFLGRDQELALVRKTLAGGRLATLVGPGGVGKTRLAQKATAAEGSVWWVDLAPLRGPDAVPQALADALDLDVLPGTPLQSSLREWARGAAGLLVLDNCEHLLAAVAGLAQQLLAVPSALRLLATSRERLSVEGEQVLVVPPLAVPAPDAEEIRTPAVRLFCDRARAVDPGFAPDR